jgi:hypothetical protein
MPTDRDPGRHRQDPEGPGRRLELIPHPPPDLPGLGHRLLASPSGGDRGLELGRFQRLGPLSNRTPLAGSGAEPWAEGIWRFPRPPGAVLVLPTITRQQGQLPHRGPAPPPEQLPVGAQAHPGAPAHASASAPPGTMPAVGIGPRETRFCPSTPICPSATAS